MSTTANPVAVVAEDEELLRLYAAGLLEERGFKVVEADSADSALKVLEKRPGVQLLFTDIQMPGKLDGMDLAREVHARWPNVLLIITSGRAKPSKSDIPDDGRFIQKPYEPADLYGEIDDLLRKKSEAGLS